MLERRALRLPKLVQLRLMKQIREIRQGLGPQPAQEPRERDPKIHSMGLVRTAFRSKLSAAEGDPPSPIDSGIRPA